MLRVNSQIQHNLISLSDAKISKAVIREAINVYNRTRSYLTWIKSTPEIIRQLSLITTDDEHEGDLTKNQLSKLCAIICKYLVSSDHLNDALFKVISSLKEHMLNQGIELDLLINSCRASASGRITILGIDFHFLRASYDNKYELLHSLENLTKLATIPKKNIEWITLLNPKKYPFFPEEICSQVNFDKLCHADDADWICMCFSSLRNLQTQFNFDKLFEFSLKKLKSLYSITTYRLLEDKDEIQQQDLFNELSNASETLLEELEDGLARLTSIKLTARQMRWFLKLGSKYICVFSKAFNKLPDALKTIYNFDLLILYADDDPIYEINIQAIHRIENSCNALSKLPLEIQTRDNLISILRLEGISSSALMSYLSSNIPPRTQYDFHAIYAIYKRLFHLPPFQISNNLMKLDCCLMQLQLFLMNNITKNTTNIIVEALNRFRSCYHTKLWDGLNEDDKKKYEEELESTANFLSDHLIQYANNADLGITIENKLFSDVLYDISLCIAKMLPRNTIDPSSQEEIPAENAVFLSDRFQFDIEYLVQWINTKNKYVYPLMIEKEFSDRDIKTIQNFARIKKLPITVQLARRGDPQAPTQLDQDIINAILQEENWNENSAERNEANLRHQNPMLDHLNSSGINRNAFFQLPSQENFFSDLVQEFPISIQNRAEI